MTNFALEFTCENFLFMSSHSFKSKFCDQAKDIIKNSHVYCVVDCPRISIIPESLRYEIFEERLVFALDLEYRVNGRLKIMKVLSDYPTPIPGEIVKLEVDSYPHLNLKLLNSKNEIIASTTAPEIAYQFQIHDLIELNVLYIGQSTGLIQESNSLKRLRSHSTLQTILADANSLRPDRSIFVGMFTFSKPKFYFIMDGMDHSKIFGSEDLLRFFKIKDFKLNKKQQIAIIEAALVRYFQPVYNEYLKKNLPSKNSTILKQCYQFDFSAINVNLNTENISRNNLKYYLYSDHTEKKYEHLISIELHNPMKKKGFYSLAGESFAPKNVIRHN